MMQSEISRQSSSSDAVVAQVEAAKSQESSVRLPEDTSKLRAFSDFISHAAKDIQDKTASGGSLVVTLQRNLAISSALFNSDFGNCLSRGRKARQPGREKRQQLRMTVERCDKQGTVAASWGQDFAYALQECWLSPCSRRCEEDGEGSLKVAQERETMQLTVPLPLSDGGLASFLEALRGWTAAAARTLVDTPAAVPLLQVVAGSMAMRGFPAAAALLPAGALPLKLGSFGFGGLTLLPASSVGLLSLASAVMFIGSIHGLNKHSTAQKGNMLGILATALGILSVMGSPGFGDAELRFLATFGLAGIVGYKVASNVSMEDMPQLVAGFHSFVGLAAVLAGFAEFLQPGPFSTMKALELFAGTAIGSMTFSGSIIAAGKLHGVIPGKPIIIDNRWLLNSLGLASSVTMGALFSTPAIYASGMGSAFLFGNTAIWAALGINMVLPVGGADMPVIVSLLNACSGLATSAAGFMLSNNLLTITGALVASSGTLLSDIMCRGINRSMTNVLIGGFGTSEGTSAASAAGGQSGEVHEVSAASLAAELLEAKRVVIIPGYGLAVARCQNRLADVVSLLRQRGVTVHFAIHPVAGRLPGHMNVLLAEADVPYDIVREMEDINEDMASYDVAIVVGANDIVNPATQTDPSSPIYGMPAIEVWKCKSCVVLKRSMATGYSGVDNPLFYLENVRMLFGSAKQTVDALYHSVPPLAAPL
eukprot:TRINITY_DN2089_c0_g1_i1.p1 TRINITY_DN2089_c0_g1~~TRINITY_DN2089_c0_g1_i1.p1  ORF type:complete len:707 (+),score=121.35 TRINITY_DN2089_c0_g1_i1:58-2178(+)